MTPKPHTCAGCPAVEYGLGFVPPTTTVSKSTFVVVGQGPGEQEALFSQPFYPRAPSGRMLRGWLEEAGIPPERTAFGNIVQCWLPATRLSDTVGKGSRAPTPAETAHCYRAHVRPWLRSLPEEAHVLAVGAPATRFLLGLSPETPADRLAGVTHRFDLPPTQET